MQEYVTPISRDWHSYREEEVGSELKILVNAGLERLKDEVKSLDVIGSNIFSLYTKGNNYSKY